MRSNDDIDDDMEKEEEEESRRRSGRKEDRRSGVVDIKFQESRDGYQLSIHKLSVKPQQLSLPSLTSYCRRAPTLVSSSHGLSPGKGMENPPIEAPIDSRA